MRRVTAFGVSRSLFIFAILFALWGAGAVASGRSGERTLDRNEMITSFGGQQQSYCCGFNPGCYFANTYSQTCPSLSMQSMCTSVTMPNSNNKLRCTPTNTMTGSCLNQGGATDVLCAQCVTCQWTVVQPSGNSYCNSYEYCGEAYNYSGCMDSCVPAQQP